MERRCRAVRESRSLYHPLSYRTCSFPMTYSSVLNDQLPPLIYKTYPLQTDSNGASQSHDLPYGSVFNLEFSPEDNTLLAAHSNKAISVHDPQTGHQVHVLPTAHDDSVNVLTFLNSHLFVSGSDDKTIKVWDMRTLGSPVAVLMGHTGWVKNVEYDSKNNLLFSVAFNDGIIKWDLENLSDYSHSDGPVTRIFSFEDPVRMRISSDGSKMVFSLRKNIVFEIADFDGSRVDDISELPTQLLSQVNSSMEIEKGVAVDPSVRCNRPFLHVISQLNVSRYRSALSLAFPPTSNTVLALRVMDIKQRTLIQELSLLYDLHSHNNDRIQPLSEDNFLKYSDEDSPVESLDVIKEVSFSPDGRLLLSPYMYGVRLMAVDNCCTPIDTFYDSRFTSGEKDMQTKEFECVADVRPGHSEAVLTCKMSKSLALATGCMEGRVMVTQPRL